MFILPIQSRQVVNNSLIRSLGLSFQFFCAISSSHPSVISPSKKGNKLSDLKGTFCNGYAKDTGVAFFKNK